MQYRFLGSPGLQVSALSFGAWVTFGNQTDQDLATECMTKAFDAGVNFFDNAEAYGAGRAEEIMGEALKRVGWGRSEFVVSTKRSSGAARVPTSAACRVSTSSKGPTS
jgi:aryl-alcohol dehydrogenase-like predicted oxidoreductase